MKICARCSMKLKDEETFCSRCGGTNFKMPQQKQNNQQNNMNNMQGMNMNMNMQNPQGMNNMQGMNMNMQNMNMQNMNMQNMNMQNMNMQNMNMQGMNMGMQNMQGMNMGMTQQQSSGLKSLFKSPKQKKAEMEAEMAIMRQMQQQKAQQQNQQQQSNNVKPGQKTNMFQNNQFSEAEPDMSTTEWLITLCILIIPVINIIYIIKGMNEPKYPPYRQNYLKAFGIYYGASLLISIIIAIIITMLTT